MAHAYVGSNPTPSTKLDALILLRDRTGVFALLFTATDALRAMLCCVTAYFTPAAISAMRKNPTTNRREAAEQLVSVAGGELMVCFGRVTNGPGARVIDFRSCQNVKTARLLIQEEIVPLRKNAACIRGAHESPGQSVSQRSDRRHAFAR